VHQLGPHVERLDTLRALIGAEPAWWPIEWHRRFYRSGRSCRLTPRPGGGRETLANSQGDASRRCHNGADLELGAVFSVKEARTLPTSSASSFKSWKHAMINSALERLFRRLCRHAPTR
jgi:hypothetical protein